LSGVLKQISNLLKGYNGNSNLKKAGEQIAFTADNVKEWIKCKDDPVYFLNNYAKIISLDDGLVSFKTFDYQNRTIESMHNNRNSIIMFPRQAGKTTVVAGYILHYILFSDNIPKVAIVAHKASGAREVMGRIQLMYEYLPKWMQKGVKTWNKGNIILEGENGADGAEVFTGATTGAGLRGKSVSLLYVDECAIIPNTIADEFFTATYPIVSSGDTTKIIMSSTPKGYNHFWKFWSEAGGENELASLTRGCKPGKNGFVPIRAKWQEHPRRTQKWADEQLALLGLLQWTQEGECSFLGSSATLVSSSCLANMVVKPFTKVGGSLSIHEAPIAGHNYVMTVDPSKGIGRDYSVFSIIDVTCLPYKVVGMYRDNSVSPMFFPSIIHRVATEYNEAFVLFEINVSEQIPHILYHEIGYENLLMVGRGPKGQMISSGFGSSTKLGLTMDKKVKLYGCNNLKILLEENKLLVNNHETINELSTFIDNNKGTYAADDGYHDDLVMTLVIFAWLTTQQYFNDINMIDIRARIYEDRMRAIDDEMLPHGFFVDGNSDDEVEMMNF
jgi:hypothetical protein